MVYVFYGLNTFLIDREIEKLKENRNDFGYEKYDLEESNLTDILFHADEINLFSKHQLIVVDNAFIFSAANKKEGKQDLDGLESYFKNPNPNTTLVFRINKEKLDERKKIVKLAKEKGYLKEYNQVDALDKIVLQMLDDYTMDKETLSFFLHRVGKDLSLLEQEIKKIKLYKAEEKEITKEDISNLTSQNLNTDIFNLIDAIILKRKQEAITCYHEMLKLGEEPIMILVLLANQFRMIYQVKKLYQMGYSEKDISSKLKVHWYPVRKTLGRMQEYKEEQLLEYIYQLASLDVAIKKGEIEKEISLELFILNV